MKTLKFLLSAATIVLLAGVIVFVSCKKEEKTDCTTATKELTELQGKAQSITTGGKTACLNFVKSYKDLLKKHESCYAGQKAQLDQTVASLETMCNMLQ